MTDFAQAFQNNHNNISDAVERDQSAASQVIPSHSVKSHDVPFLTTLSEPKNLFANYGIFVQNLAFPSLVSHAILQNVH